MEQKLEGAQAKEHGAEDQGAAGVHVSPTCGEGEGAVNDFPPLTMNLN